jgi:hypothetical protein
VTVASPLGAFGQDGRVFSAEEREAVWRRLLQLAEADGHVVAAAEVGSRVVGADDRWSDLDLTLGVDGATVEAVLDEWTRQLADEFEAFPLVDLARGATTYRVFLLPDELQIDVSATPAAQFRPGGPRFRLLFGHTVDDTPVTPTPTAAADLFGWGVIYGIHARRCIERARFWQAEHYINATRDHALMLACLRHDLPVVQARGYDDLPDHVLGGLGDTHVGSLQPDHLRSAFAASMRALLHEADDLPETAAVIARLDPLG